MATKKISNEEKIIDLLEKNIIVQLYNGGATRNQIVKILKISPNRVSEITKYLNKG